MTAPAPHILCIGSVLWDLIGRCDDAMHHGADKPGRITRLPGGVAMNIAMTMVRFGFTPALLTAIGRDAEGDELIAACADMGMITDHVFRDHGLPTDRYMAVEGANGLIAAIADAHSLEAAGARILAPLTDGSLGTVQAPYSGLVALDGNLTVALLEDIAADPAFAAADLRVAPASPGKAERLRPLLSHPGATLYVNLEEAGLLHGTTFDSAAEAARALSEHGAKRVLVTDGNRAAAKAHGGQVLTAAPPQIRATRITGAGDTFMAAHISAETAQADPQTALDRAVQAAAAYVSGKDPT